MSKNIILPEQCYSIVPSTGELILLKHGEERYFKTDYSVADRKKNRIAADRLNKKLGVTKAQESAMLVGSIFGFTAAGANPKNYDINGHPRKPQKVEHER